MNSAGQKKPVSRALAVVAGWAIWTWAVWRVFTGKPSPVKKPKFSEETKLPDTTISRTNFEQFTSLGRNCLNDQSRQLESLSQSSFGDAPLDRLARAATEERTGADSVVRGIAISAPGAILNTQALESELLPGWSTPRPDRLPVPTFAPAIMAMGIVLFAMGLVTTWYVCAVGAMIFAVATWRWVGELQGE